VRRLRSTRSSIICARRYPSMRDGAVEPQSMLAQQIEICRSYLEVMRIRIGSRFDYSIDVPAAFAGLSFPPFMLISLVENAVKHGVERKPGPCNVRITARLVDSDQPLLEVAVSDDGAGLSEGIGSGVGLANIRAQLALRFGTSASLSLEGGSAGGAVAALRIPFPAHA
jgi:LytS/YehU family sensor histidine kinase